MNPIPVVTEEEITLARSIEDKLIALPHSAGVLFVGVSVRPQGYEANGTRLPSVFHVWVGCDRARDERTIPFLVLTTLRDEIEAGTAIKVEAHRGVIFAVSRNLELG